MRGRPPDRFAREAALVLEGRCASAACHGVGPDEPWPATPGFFVRVDATGGLADLEEARAAAAAQVSVRTPLASSLLRIPSPVWAGGGPHAGGALFTGPDEPALRALVRWIQAEPRGGEDLELETLCRYMSDRLFDEDVRINVIRSRSVVTPRSRRPSARTSSSSPGTSRRRSTS